MIKAFAIALLMILVATSTSGCVGIALPPEWGGGFATFEDLGHFSVEPDGTRTIFKSPSPGGGGSE